MFESYGFIQHCFRLKIPYEVLLLNRLIFLHLIYLLILIQNTDQHPPRQINIFLSSPMILVMVWILFLRFCNSLNSSLLLNQIPINQLLEILFPVLIGIDVSSLNDLSLNFSQSILSCFF